MATVDKHELLFCTDLKYFKALQMLGKSIIFDRYNIAKPSIIDKYIEPKYNNFLAYPVKDGDKIEFHGIKSKTGKPQLLSELQGDDAGKYHDIKVETIEHYQNKIGELKNDGKFTEAEFLTNAIKFEDDRFIFCYDDNVILGVWGMQLRTNVREGINEIVKRSATPKKKKKEIEEPSPPQPQSQDGFEVDTTPIEEHNVYFNAGEHGDMVGNNCLSKEKNSIITNEEIPQVQAKEGYEFVGWNENPHEYQVCDNKEFTALYRPLAPPTPPIPPRAPWYKRFWTWLGLLFGGSGCLKWLLRLLLLLLLLLLLFFLVRNCQRKESALGDNDSTWLIEDPNRGNDGGIYDPNNPYEPVPTPPDYGGILPPEQGVLPPLDGDVDIIPGNPSIIANRLNILMENKDKTIMDLAKSFKEKYPGDEYQVVYYDDVIKRMQIEIPRDERVQMRSKLPTEFAPEYEIFVFDEALFEGTYIPNDPACSDTEKGWYLKAIRAPQAWDITQGSDKITVAIVDNGFNLKHPELASKIVRPYNVWTHSKEVFPQQVDHGTHVAGTALAIADNSKGICGIAPKCRFMPIQVADKRGLMTTTSVLDGILYALYQGADVVNVSLGGQFAGLDQYPESVQQELIRNHFKEEERLWREVMRIAANHNATIVLAAGNDNVLAGIEAMQRPELFVTVSAVDKTNNSFGKAEFSNYGRYSTISAPGVDIYSCIGTNDYQTMSGTSMAAPIVTGAIALMKSINDTITNKQIICILKNTGLATQGGIGRLIQIDKALEVVKSGEKIDCTPPPSTGDVQILLSWNNYNDLDLICVDPLGETVFHKNRRVSSGGELEIDMNVEYPDSKTPIENIYWMQGQAPHGQYNVYLKYHKKHESNIDKTPYSIKVKYDGKTEDYNGVICTADKVIHICSFSAGSSDNSSDNTLPQTPNTPPLDNRRSKLEQEKARLKQELDRVNEELRRIENRR